MNSFLIAIQVFGSLYNNEISVNSSLFKGFHRIELDCIFYMYLVGRGLTALIILFVIFGRAHGHIEYILCYYY